MSELLPCPFCGGEAEVERYGDNRQSTIVACTECGCRLENGESFRHGTIWNTRADAARIEALERQIAAADKLADACRDLGGMNVREIAAALVAYETSKEQSDD